MKDDLELFVWRLYEMENKVLFRLEIEKDFLFPFLDVGITTGGGGSKQCDGPVVHELWSGQKPLHF